MAPIWLVTLLLGVGFAVSTANGMKGRVVNIIIILVCMGVGAALGFALGEGRGNLGMIPDQAMPFAMIFGVLGAMVCVAKDTLQPKE